MFLNKLSIVNYKNICEAGLAFSPKLNCFIGHNGEGKTNLLDAVYYLSFCRSSCSVTDSNVMRHGTDFFMLDGRYVNDEGDDEDISCGMKRGSKKHFKRNKKEYKRLSAHIGLIPLILASPADTVLIDGGSEERRRLMDVVISQYDVTYIDALNRYNKALQQRNSLLRAEAEPDADLIGLLEEQMAVHGEIVAGKRKAFVDELVDEMRKAGISVWYDTTKISWGDSMRQRIDDGLRRSKFGVVVLSPNYIAEGKYWTKAELNGLFQLESINGKTLLPIWYNLNKQDVINFSPIIADKKALTTASMTAQEIAAELAALLQESVEENI